MDDNNNHTSNDLTQQVTIIAEYHRSAASMITRAISLFNSDSTRKDGQALCKTSAAWAMGQIDGMTEERFKKTLNRFDTMSEGYEMIYLLSQLFSEAGLTPNKVQGGMLLRDKIMAFYRDVKDWDVITPEVAKETMKRVIEDADKTGRQT